MLAIEVVEYEVRYERRRTMLANEVLAKSYIRSVYGQEVKFRGRDEGYYDSTWFGPNEDGEDAGHFKISWIWNRVPSPDERERLTRILHNFNNYGTLFLTEHLAELRGTREETVTETGEALIEAILLEEANVEYCGSCPGRHGNHNMSCAKTKGRLSLNAVEKDGRFHVIVPGPLSEGE